jgi:hypothetical protein
MLKISKPKLNSNSVKKVAFLAVFGVTGIAAFAAYHYVKKELNKFDDINWDGL